MRGVQAGLVAAALDLLLVREALGPLLNFILQHTLLVEHVPLTRLLKPVIVLIFLFSAREIIITILVNHVTP